MTIFLLHMEPIEQRYSSQWLTYFNEVFKNNNIDFINIFGESVKSELSSKYFLDPIQTNIWKLTQLANLLKHYDTINDGDTVFFTDLWNPGLEVLPYIKALTKKDINISGYLHAGTYDPWDLTAQTGMTSWASLLETSWLSVCNNIFVATQFHKDLLCSNRIIDKNHVKVVGFPLDIKGLRALYGNNYTNNNKQDYIVFTGRKSVEKGYQKILDLQSDYDIICSLDQKRSKDEYYNLLRNAHAIIAPSEQETFGIGVVEGMALGCVPIVPNKLAFQETVPEKYRYNPIMEPIRSYIDRSYSITKQDRLDLQDYVSKYDYRIVITRIITQLGLL